MKRIKKFLEDLRMAFALIHSTSKQKEAFEGAGFVEAVQALHKKHANLEDFKGLTGLITMIVRDKDGNIKETRKIKNLITNAGKAGAASRLNGAGSEVAFTYLAVGIGTNAAAVGDTTLQTEITDSGLARAAATCTRVTTSVTNDTAQLDKTWSVSGTKAVTECGIFNDAAAGTLLGRQVFTAVNVVSGDSLQVIYKVACS
jgi:hypothetical protein